MRRKQKERFTPEFNYKKVSYVCPECRRRYEVELVYLTQNLTTKLEKGRWCYCGAAHELKYKTLKKRNGNIGLKVIEFTCNGETKPKKFRLLN